MCVGVHTARGEQQTSWCRVLSEMLIVVQSTLYFLTMYGALSTFIPASRCPPTAFW
jgi:hypothetical protein